MFRLLLSHHQALKIQIRVTMFIYCTVGSPMLTKYILWMEYITFNYVQLDKGAWLVYQRNMSAMKRIYSQYHYEREEEM